MSEQGKSKSGPWQRLGLVLVAAALLFGLKQLISLMPDRGTNRDDRTLVLAWMKDHVKDPGAEFEALAGVRHFWGASYRVLRFTRIDELGQRVVENRVLQTDASGMVVKGWTPDEFAKEAGQTRSPNEVSVAMIALGFRR